MRGAQRRVREGPATLPAGKEFLTNGGMVMVKVLLWFILLVISWPMAILVLILYPLIWLFLLPFRIFGIAVEGVLDLIRAIFYLPGRLLGGGPRW